MENLHEKQVVKNSNRFVNVVSILHTVFVDNLNFKMFVAGS